VIKDKAPSTLPIKADSSLTIDSPSIGGTLKFMKIPTHRVEEFLEFALESKLHLGYGQKISRINATGGGSFKFSRAVSDKVGVELVQRDEMWSLVRGLDFLFRNSVEEAFVYDVDKKHTKKKKPAQTKQKQTTSSSSTEDAEAEEEEAEEDGSQDEDTDPHAHDECRRYLRLTEFTYPYILVSIGSGTSILRVDAPGHNKHNEKKQNKHKKQNSSTSDSVSVTDSDSVSTTSVSRSDSDSVSDSDSDSDSESTAAPSYHRVSGTLIGGGTYLGLAHMLTGLSDFEELKRLSRRGDNRAVDTLVSDIYGGDCASLGLPADVIASSFGKAGFVSLSPGQSWTDVYRPEDMAKSLMTMICVNIAQIAYMCAEQHKCTRVFFTGGFVHDNPAAWEFLSFGVKFWSGGTGEALFLKHDGYLGALGCLITPVDPFQRRTAAPGTTGP